MGPPWGHKNTGELREPPAWGRSPLVVLYLLEMFKHLDILPGYPLDQLRPCWHLEWAMVTVVLSAGGSNNFGTSPSRASPFPCARTTGLLFLGVPSAVGCQRTCQEEKIPCWCKCRSSPGQWCVCSLPGWEGLGVTQSLCPFHTQKKPLNPLHQLHKFNLGELHVLR